LVYYTAKGMIATQLVINRLPSYPIRHTQIKIKGLSKVSRISVSRF